MTFNTFTVFENTCGELDFRLDTQALPANAFVVAFGDCEGNTVVYPGWRQDQKVMAAVALAETAMWQ